MSRAADINDILDLYGLRGIADSDPRTFADIRAALRDAYDAGKRAARLRRAAVRAAVRARSCPACGAGPGEPCVGVRGAPRVSNHRARRDP